MQIIPFFKHQAVNDLAWSCFGPNLVDSFSSTIEPFELTLSTEYQQWLIQLDQEPTPLLTHLQQLKSPRIGLYFEALWQFFLSNNPRWHLVAHNLPIYRNKKTLGEFDLIIHDKVNHEYIHLEIANKYFLNSSLCRAKNNQPFDDGFSQWIGPNGADRLDKKINHLISHQTQLGETLEGRVALQKLGIEKIKKAIALKGALFYPINQQRQLNSPLSLNHQAMHWVAASQFSHLTSCDYLWLILEKKRWISPAQGNLDNTEHPLMNKKAMSELLINYFKDNKGPLIIVAVSTQKNRYYERLRMFITPNNWPLSIS